MNEQVCREWLGPDKGECGKPATTSINLGGYGKVYKCERHARRFRADTRYVIKELT